MSRGGEPLGINISIDGEGDIVIKRKKRDKETNPTSVQSQVTRRPSSKDRSATLIFSKNILDQMEIRAEGVFRPQMQDVETAYGMSGDEVIDTLHKFTTNEVIRQSTPSAIYTTTENKIEYILEDRDDKDKNPRMVVDIHTHPAGIAEPSEEDRNSMKKIAQIFREKLPRTRVLFGIHAISEEIGLSKRTKPEAIDNKIKWRSLTREHEVAFYDETARPVDVIIREL